MTSHDDIGSRQFYHNVLSMKFTYLFKLIFNEHLDIDEYLFRSLIIYHFIFITLIFIIRFNSKSCIFVLTDSASTISDSVVNFID